MGPCCALFDAGAAPFLTPQVAIAAIVWDAMYPEQEFEGQVPAYPYMRIRSAKLTFPWGPDGLMEHHVHVKPPPE